MIRPVRWPHITRFIVFAHHYAAYAVRAFNADLAERINRQAHRQLCNQLRDLAARIVTESP